VEIQTYPTDGVLGCPAGGLEDGVIEEREGH